MIKSELVQKIAAQNPHLYQRDIENNVNAILGEVIAATAIRLPRGPCDRTGVGPMHAAMR